MHKYLRKYELIYDINKEETKQIFNITDPDTFPIYNLSYKYKSEVDYISTCNIIEDYYIAFLKEVGFNLKVKKSKIKHLDAHDGVFLNCLNKTNKIFILPGTLIGFFPGVIYSKKHYEKKLNNSVTQSSILKNSPYPYLKRFDNSYVDPYAAVPYPLFNTISIEDFEEYKQNTLANNQKLNYIDIPLYKTNNLALGHLINHPPPDTEANVTFIDFNIPANFFPSYFLRYMPNVRYSNENYDTKTRINIGKLLFKQKENEVSNSNRSIRLTGIVSIKEILNVEELYADYM